MRHGERAPYDEALRPARLAAYPPGEFVDQESFMRASQILALAHRAGIGPGVSVLDLCCGVAGPGRLITSELDCRYLGVDMSASAIELARARASGLSCQFEVGQLPPVPNGPFDVVLLLETTLAFQDKETLFRQTAAALVPGGRLAFTVEEGRPLGETERQAMPDAETVWPIPLSDLVPLLADAGMDVRSMWQCTGSHQLIAEALHRSFLADQSAIAAALGDDAVENLLVSHRLWAEWMATGRIRKFAVVAEKSPR